jgi:tetratricopeptide (TPR) repeat protein
MIGNLVKKISVFVLIILFFSHPAFSQQSPYEKGMKAYTQKDYHKSVAYLKKSVATKPDPRAYYLLGYALYKTKNFEESMKYFKKAYAMNPNISITVPGKNKSKN